MKKKIDKEIMFRNIWYDSKNNLIHLWWNVDGKNVYDKYEYEHNFYRLNPDESKYKTEAYDLLKRPMIKQTVAKKKDVPKNIPWFDLAEEDIREETKFLHNFFGKMELSPNIDNVQIMYYDIETR
jgi:hypothetical protein